MFKYVVYEDKGNLCEYKVTDQGILPDCKNLESAKEAVERRLPKHITERGWTPGEVESHWLIQIDENPAMVCVEPCRAVENIFNSEMFRRAVMKGSTQTDIAEEIGGIRQQQIARWLSQRDGIKVSALISICNVLDIDLRVFFTRREITPPDKYPKHNPDPTFIKE